MKSADGSFNVITRKWNSETLSCDHMLGERIVEMWELSEFILEPFMFGDS